jgi:hypothetical protein
MKFFTRKCLSAVALAFFSMQAAAAEHITVLGTKYLAAADAPAALIETLINQHFPKSQYRDIKVQIITNAAREPDHLLVFLFLKYKHGLKLARVNIDSRYHLLSIQNKPHLTAEDFSQQPGGSLETVACPDETTQFITFAPNSDELEQAITREVGDAAEKHKLKVVRLIHFDATRKSYLNYMSCANIKGNFYDGDAYHDESDPDSDFIVTVDGVIQAKDIVTYLKNHFRFKTVNMWVACGIYHDPMKTAMLDTAQSQKFAAGINDLFVGPSDLTAACAMEAALNGKPMQASFQECYTQNLDHWGFSGKGSDYFGF